MYFSTLERLDTLTKPDKKQISKESKLFVLSIGVIQAHTESMRSAICDSSSKCCHKVGTTHLTLHAGA